VGRRRLAAISAAITIAVTALVASPVAAATEGSIGGTVFDSRWRAIPGLTVSLEPADGGPAVAASTVTGSDGTWVIDPVPYGNYLVRYRGLVDAWAFDSLDAEGASAFLVDSDYRPDVFDSLSSYTLPDNYTVEVLGADGATLSLCPRFYPADDIASGPWGEECSPVDGRVHGRIDPGTYLVEFLDYDGAYARTWLGSDGSQAGATPVTITADGLADLGSVTMPVAGSIQVRVKPQGKDATYGADQVCVTAYVGRTEEYGSNGCSDDSGTVTIRGLGTGTYTLLAQPSSLDWVPRWSGDERDQTEATPVEVQSGSVTVASRIVTPKSGSITGVVRDALTGAPLAGYCASTGRYSFLGGEDGTRSFSRSSCTGEDGRYTVRGLDSGDYRVQFVPDIQNWPAEPRATAFYGGRNSFTADLVPVSLGTVTRHINVRLLPAGSLTGQVLDEDGQPVAYRQVFAVDPRTGYSVGYGETSEDGTFRIGLLNDGRVALDLAAAPGEPGWWTGSGLSGDRADARVFRTESGIDRGPVTITLP
jgi:hypothetical protein